MKNENNKIATKTNVIFSNVILLWEVLISLVLIIHVFSFGFKVGASSYALLKNGTSKSEYAQSLINDEELDIITSENLKIIQSGEATDNEIIVYYWITNLNFIVVLAIAVTAMEKLRRFFRKDNLKNPFTDNSLELFKFVVRCIEVVIGVEVFAWLVCAIFTPFDMEFVLEIGIFEIVCVFFVYYLLRKGNEMFNEKKIKG